jgi:hypothetical protein
MKTLVSVSAALFFLASCKLDNYNAPSANLHGVVKDIKTGTLIQQDVDAGSRIIYREYGYQNPEEQQMIFRETGEYRNNLVFAGNYDFYFNESNFVKPDTLKNFTVKGGDNLLDFSVQPYIRVSNVSITKSGNEIVATFTITPTVANNVKQIGFFGHADRIVGNQFALQRSTQDVNAPSMETPATYTLKLSTSGFVAGKTYYFRVGALIDAPNAKYNYAPSITITI